MDRINQDRVSRIVPEEYLLNDVGIEKAISEGDIFIQDDLTEDQFQPATLDMRIGKVKVYDKEAIAKNVESWNNRDAKKFDDQPSDEFAKTYDDKKDILIELPPNSFAEVYFHEKIHWNNSIYYVKTDLRSTRGRSSIRLYNNEITKDSDMKYITVRNNNPNIIGLYGNDKFAQLFFHTFKKENSHDGYVVTDEKEAKEIAHDICDGPFKMIGPYIVFTVGDHVMKFKKNIGVIDTRRNYKDEELYDLFKTTKNIPLNFGDAIIAQVMPRLNLPKNVAISLLHNTPYYQNSGLFGPDGSVLSLEHHTANAGWVDPGYSGFVTAHPLEIHPYGQKSKLLHSSYIKSHNIISVKKGDSLVLGKIIKYYYDCKKGYGSKELKSHYQNSIGVGSRS
ncbi:MAG: hypothetical protein WC755_02325 [Candidatus Woesearchaeota archaeon]|jgi:deoxycytidine triphosphate deaminase